jgi:hypothetical protein
VDIEDALRIKPKGTHIRRKRTLGTHDARVHIPRARDHADKHPQSDTLGVSPISDNQGTHTIPPAIPIPTETDTPRMSTRP